MTSAEARSNASARGSDTVLLVDNEVLIRTPVAEYLRTCGYRVLEARNFEGAIVMMETPTEAIATVLSDADSGFRLSQWIKAVRPNTKIVIGGTAERAAHAAADLCDSGPTSTRP